jgi:microcystin synthetase protein McyG
MKSSASSILGSRCQKLATAGTLADSLLSAAANSTGGLIYLRLDGVELRQSYAELLAEAGKIAEGLREFGVKRGDPVLLQLEAAEDFIPGFWGCVLAGAVAVPVAVAPIFSQSNSALQKLINAAKLLEHAPVLAQGAAVEGLRLLPPTLGVLSGPVIDLSSLRHRASAEAKMFTHGQAAGADLAVLLLTSGSTGQPKGVPLTHSNLLSMAAGTIEGNGFTPAEVTLNWMALDHVGSVSFLGTMAVVLGCTQIHVPTSYILQEPLRWLDLISRHQATISWAPNFAFTLFLDRAAAVQVGSWDLSSMRFLVNAGEPVVARTARKFITLLQRHGLPVGALRPAFGMSETCSGITWSRGLTLENTGDEVSFVDLGPCNPGAEMRVVNEKNEPLPDGETGLLQLRGPSVFSGYYRNPEENAKVIREGWFETGDLAYLENGCLRIAGRIKDVIIINGANFYCHEVEAAAETVPGVAKSFTAACAVRDQASETDQLALFFCVAPGHDSPAEAIARAIRAKLIQQVGLLPTYLVALTPAEIPKTEIGKIQRGQLKRSFESGSYRQQVIQLARTTAAKPSPKRSVSRTELASAIAEIWQEVLSLESVGYDETFFELGGHSLLIVQVQVRLQALIGRPIAVVELFNCPTVRTMAEHFAQDFDREHRAASGLPSLQASASVGSSDIAIIGIGLRFPGASSPEDFWRVLDEGRETISFFSAEESLAEGVDPELVKNPHHVRAAPILDAPDAFDADFFRYTAKEARLIDPQQRIFLEVCWEAFEDAGYDPLTFPGKVGLFAAAGMNTYLPNNLWANQAFLQSENGGRMLTVDSMSGFNVMITNDKDYLPMRVSYKLNLRGPSVNVQSACSSTLLTLHEACKSIRMGDCSMALAGGVSIKLPQHAGHLYSPGMLNSPDGHCRAYDEKAEGTIFGNGAGVVLLKPLAEAQAAGDRIYAVVKATASNNDGAGKVGFTAPSSSGQEDVCAEAMARAGVTAESVTFMEGHGTGTELGDPIEVNALSEAFRRHTVKTGYCALGSVKTNVGHLQIASGIAGLIKTTLALHHRRIPGTLHFNKPNPRIDFPRTPFFVNSAAIDWISPQGPRRAGVNSLGIGGTNVHAILEEAPVATPIPVVARAGGWVLPLSTRHPAALRSLAQRYAQLLDRADEVDLEDLTFTAQVGRASLPQRAAFVASSRADLNQQLRRFAGAAPEPSARIDFDQRGLAFSFSADSAGVYALARCLWRDEPFFRQAWERALTILTEVTQIPVPRSVAEGVWPAGVPTVNQQDRFSDPVLFTFEYALAELLSSFGIEASSVGGTGLGEWVMAARAGVFSIEDALRLLVAADSWANSASNKAAAEAALKRVAAQVVFAQPASRMLSGQTGQWLEAEWADPAHWLGLMAGAPISRNAVHQIFAREGRPIVVELGAAAATLAGDVDLRCLVAADFPRLLATLFALGYPVQWASGRKARMGRRIELPLYPWQHQSYWIHGVDVRTPDQRSVNSAGHPLLGQRWGSPRIKACIYESRFDLTTLPYLAEHMVHGSIVAPGALYLSQVAMQAAEFLLGAGPRAGELEVKLSDVAFLSAMVINPAQPRTVQTVFTEEAGKNYAFEVLSWIAAEPQNVVVHATGRCAPAPIGPTAVIDLAARRHTLRAQPDLALHYAVMDRMEVRLGPSFRWWSALHHLEGESLVQLEAPAGLAQIREWHPGLVDSFLQAAASALGLDGALTLIPFRLDQVIFHRNPDGGSLFAHAQKRVGERHAYRSDVRVYDASGALVAEALGFELRHLQAHNVKPAASLAAPKYFETHWRPLAAPAASAPLRTAGAWLFLSDGSPAVRALQQSLQVAGEQVHEVLHHQVTPAQDLLSNQAWAGVVYAWDLSVDAPSGLHWNELLICIQASLSRSESHPPRWVFLTSSAAHALAQSPLSGFVTSFRHEHPELRPLQLEIDPAHEAMDAWVPWLLDKVGAEPRLSLHSGVICGARLGEKSLVATPLRIRPEASYLVTGAAGALGQAVAEWLIAHGARSLYLSGRREAPPPLQTKITDWEQRGVRINYVLADMSDPVSVQQLVQRAGEPHGLRGVFHAAGALRDGLVRQAEVGSFTSIFGAKINGAWELHRATQNLPLDCFVLFSSIASLLGSPGQTNYAAANAYLDALAIKRQQAGLAGLSIQWGPWEGIGMTARLASRDRDRLQERGLIAMDPADALQALGQVLGIHGTVGVFAWNQAGYARALSGQPTAFYEQIFAGELAQPAPPAAASSVNQAWASLAAAPRLEAIERLIRETVAHLLGLDSYLKVDRAKGLFDLGIDSLTAIDLKDRLEKSLGHTLRSTIAFDYPTAAEMAGHLAERLFTSASPILPAAAGGAAPAMEDFESMSDSDLKQLLEKELSS